MTSKHPPFEQGKRTHVERWCGIQNLDGSFSSVTRCSEPDCELNKRNENIGESRFCVKGKSGETQILHLKPKEQYPKVFEDNDKKIEVLKTGAIMMRDPNGDKIIFDSSLSTLYDAVELSKKLRNKNR